MCTRCTKPKDPVPSSMSGNEVSPSSFCTTFADDSLMSCFVCKFTITLQYGQIKYDIDILAIPLLKQVISMCQLIIKIIVKRQSNLLDIGQPRVLIQLIYSILPFVN